MNTKKSPITIKARWDHHQVPVGSDASRGLLLEIEAEKPKDTHQHERTPVNIALVIDRSGSMDGEPMFAAIEAAVGISEQLRQHDRLSVVGYDDHIDVLLDGVVMNSEGKRKAEMAIRSLSARGMTNLAGGWLQGAKCAANVMEQHDFSSGHVILLSDGCANVGEREPDLLATLAGNLAERHVTTSCVGIGDHYSLLQMSAIAESGQGEIHQSSEPSEIIEVLMGELGEQTQIVARNFSVHLKGIEMHRARQLTRYGEMPVNDRNEYFLGNLISGQTRRLAFLVDFPAYEKPDVRQFTCTATWLDAETAIEEQQCAIDFEIEFVPPELFNKNERDKEVTNTIADIWMARQGYDAMMFNEQGLFSEAVAAFDKEDRVFSEMVEDLDSADVMMSQRHSVREASSARWDGRSKKEAMTLARKRMRQKPDYRKKVESKDWSDFTPD
jgi:Mg-chelatase subunit ChlD